MQPRKIRVVDIERLRRTLENVPESRVEEVTTVEAVRMLTSEIHAMQAKGYRLRAIAQLFSENSVVVGGDPQEPLESGQDGGEEEERHQDQDAPGSRFRAEGTAPVTESKAGGERSAASVDRQQGASLVTRSAAWGEDAHASSGDDYDDCEGDSASRLRGRSAVCVRAQGGHERHLKV
jgi:hypothetical protein